MADRRRRSLEGSRRTKGKEPVRSGYDEPSRMPIYEQPRTRAGAEEVIYSSSSSSSSSSYIDISRSYPRNKFGIRTFFTAPSERRRLRRRKSSRLFKTANSSSSSVNEDLAYGTGFIKRPKRRGVRSRKGKEIGGDRFSDRENNRTLKDRRDGGRPPLERAKTDAEILAIGAGLAKLARDQNKKDLRDARSGRVPDLGAVNPTGSSSNQGPTRGLVNSRPSHGSDTFDEDGWESASGSEDSVDSRLAYGEESKGKWSFFGRKKQRPLSRKDTIVDPRLFGPHNSLHGIVVEPVGLGEVSPWTSVNDFGQHSDFSVAPGTGPSQSGSQASLQRVYPVPTSDPGRFDARASSVVSGPDPMVGSRPGPIPIQQPQPIAPISQSVYGRSDSGGASKQARESASSGRGKSLAEAALVGVAGAAVGAAIASSRDDRKRRDDEEIDEKNRLRRRDSEKESKDIRRRDKRSSPDREERRERRREKGGSSRVFIDESRRDKKRDRRKEETREERDERRERRRDETPDDRDDRHEKRRDERRSERPDDRVEARRTKSETAVPTTVIDPFQYQVADDAFPTPTIEPLQRRIESVPDVHYVTVEREPDFSRIPPIRDARTPDFMKMHRQEEPKYIESEQQNRERGSRDRALHEAQEIYQETTHSTAPIAVAAFGAAVAAVHHADGERESRSDKRRDERRGEIQSSYDDYNSESHDKEPEKKRDPIQEEADRAYREIVMARKIASQVIRSRTPSPDRSITEKYAPKEQEEEEIIRIVTPPGMENPKKTGLYDAPNADFQLDHVLEDPMDLRTFKISSTNLVRVDAEGPYLKRDPDADRPRPFLNLVRPTPAPSPMPEKQAARSERDTSSKAEERGESKRSSESGVQQKDEDVKSTNTPTASKGVTWGENETKHYEVETPSEHKDELVSKSDIEPHETQEESKPAAKPKSKSKGWGAIAAGIIGAGVGAAAAASSSETSKTSESKENEKTDAPYEYRGVVVEPESSPQSLSERDAPPAGPKPSPNSQPSRVPGAFNDDLDFTATVAAGLQDTGFDPNIVIDDPSFRRRNSPPGSNDYRPYRAPFAETVSDLGTIPSEVSGARNSQGFILGEVASTPQDWRSVSPAKEDETPTKLSKKEQKKRDKERRRSGDVTPLDESSASRDVVEEPEIYFEPLSKKELKKRDRLARQNSQGDDMTASVADEIVQEPESYFVKPKESKKKSKSSTSVDDYAEDVSRDARRVSVPIDSFNDLRNDDDNWVDSKKPEKKSKRDSDRYDSPARSIPSSEITSELERSSSKKSRNISKRKSEQYEPEPTEISLPPSTPSETSRDGEFESRGNRKSSTRDSGIFSSADRGESRSVVSADASRYDDDEPRKSKKSRSSTKDDYDDSRSVVSAPAGDDYENSKRSKKKDKDKEKDKEKDKKSGGGFFGLFGSRSEVSARDEGPKESRDDFEEPERKKKSKRSSVPDSNSIYGDTGAQSVGDLSRSLSNGNGDKNGSYPDNPEEQNGDDPGERKKTRSRSESSSSKKDSFLGNAGTLGAGVGIAGAAVAIAAQQYQQSKAANANSSETAEHEQVRRSPGSTLPSEILDPEITERQFRPSIDPQYGDLLPLPPSNPESPNVEPLDDLPELPDSRPDTPEPERISREKSMSSVRKNLQETPMKSPSQSAVPLNFLMRNRSQPSSPGVARSSPVQSPATPNQDSLSFPRSRPRPTSWDSSKEYKPLYLVESNRRGSAAQLMEPEEELPALPPSQTTSRSSSQLDFGELSKDPLSIDTELASSKAVEELLGSEQSTPKAAYMTQDSREIDYAFDSTSSIEEPNLPSQSEQRLSSPELKSRFGEHVAEAAAVAGLVSTIGYFASSPAHPKTKEEFWDELPSAPRQPSPVNPMTKDRSSYLLQSSPMSRNLEEIESVDRDLDSPSRKQASSLPSSDTLESIQEREISDIFGSPIALREHIDQEREKTMETLSVSPRDGLAEHATTNDLPGPEVQQVQDEEIAARPSHDEPEPAAEFNFITKSKKDKKKDKKKGKALSRSSTQDDFSFQDSSKDVPKENPTPAENEPDAEEFFVTKSKKDKQKDKKKGRSTSAWEPEESESVAHLAEEPTLEAARDVFEDIGTPGNNEIDEDFFTTKSKKDKKKDKKSRSISSWNPEEPQIVSKVSEEAAPEASRALSEGVSTPVENVPVGEFLATKYRKDKKKDKKKGKLASTWEPEENETMQQSKGLVPEPIVNTTQDLPETLENPVDMEQADEFSTSKSKKDKKKDKKGAKSAFSWDPEDDGKSQPLPDPRSESRGFAEDTTSGEVQGLEDFPLTKSKKDQKKDKNESKSTSAAGSEKDETELSMPATNQDLVEEPSSISQEKSVPGTAIIEQTEEYAMRQAPEFRDVIAESTPYDTPSITRDSPSKVRGLSQDDDVAAREERLVTTESPIDEEALRGSTSKDHRSETIEDFAQEYLAADEVTAFDTKKDRKKRGKSPMNWEQEPEAAVLPETISLQGQPESSRDVIEATAPADEFFVSESKKSKDKKKHAKSVTAWEPEEEPGSSPTTQQCDDTQQYEAATSKKGKKIIRKLSSTVPEDDFTSEPQEPVENLAFQESNEPVEELKAERNKRPVEALATTGHMITESEDMPNAPETLSPKPTPIGGPGPWPTTPATPWTSGEVSESSSKEYFPAATTHHSPLTQEVLGSYFPSTEALLPVTMSGAAMLGAEFAGKESPLSEDHSYKDATTSRPVHVDEALISLGDAKPATDGFTAGYGNEQVSLAKRLQEELSSGSKKSKKGRKRQSLPPTPAGEPSRSRTVEELPELPPRARSLSIGPAATRTGLSPLSGERRITYSEDQIELARELKSEFESGNKKSKKDKKKRQGLSRSSTQDDIGFDKDVEETQMAVPYVSKDLQEPEISESAPKGDGFAAGYQEDQLSIARQLQAEFGKKSKKDKKRRSTPQTPQEQAPRDDYFGEPGHALVSGVVEQERELSISEPSGEKEKTRDGLAIGYSAEQLELARQLKEEFGSGSKKGKKDRKRQSTSQTPPEQEARDNYFDEPSQALAADEVEQERGPLIAGSPAGADRTRDGLAVGYKEEQLELARQLEEEFGTGAKNSKRDKKYKKRGSLLRSNTEDVFSSDPQVKDGGNLKTEQPGVVEAGPNNEPEDEFAFITKKSKKDKKGIKRGSLLMDTQGDDFSSEVHSTAENEVEVQDTDAPESKVIEEGRNEPATLEPQGEFAFNSKKSKKDKKGKKRNSLLPTTAEDDLPFETTLDDQSESRRDVDVPTRPDFAKEFSSEPLAADPEGEFAAFTKKSKKNKKGMKRDSLLRQVIEEDTSTDNFRKGVEALHAAGDMESKNIELEPAQTAPEDYSSVPAKTSKKDKKKRQSIIARDDSFDQPDIEASSKQPSEEPSAAEITVESFASEALGEPSDDTGFSTRKSKKDKKKRGSLLRTSTFDETSKQQAEKVEAQPALERQDLGDGAGTPVTPSADDQDGGLEYSSEKSKKEKKRRQSSQQASMIKDPIREDAVLSIAEDIRLSNLETEDQVPESATRETTFGENNSLSQLLNLKTEDNGPQPDTHEAGFNEGDSINMPGEEKPANGPPDIFHDFTFSNENSDKDKEEQGRATKDESDEVSRFSNPLNPIPEPKSILESFLPTDQEEPTKTENPGERDLDSFTTPALEEKIDEQVDEWSSFSVKKSKKDKKIKTSSGTASRGPSGTSTPLKPILKPEFANEELPLAVESVFEQNKPIDEPISQGFEHQTIIIAEDNNGEPADEWASFTTKKSKKDKKKRKSSLSTPAEPTEGVPTFEPKEIFVEESELHALKAPESESDAPAIRPEEPNCEIIDENTHEKDRQVEKPRDLEQWTEDSKEQESTDEAFAFVTKRPKKDKKGSKKSSRALSESGGTDSGLSDAPRIESSAQPETTLPSENLVSTPFDLQEETFEGGARDPFTSDLSQTPSKKDKRKRQATVNLNDGLNAPKPPLTSWADEVEEAEVERKVPVIQDIAKDESLAHIARTTESSPVDDFFRPSKKGKKGKKRTSEPSSIESFRPPIGSDMPKDELVDEKSNIPIIAAAGAALAGAAMLSKGAESLENTSKSETSTGTTTPQRKLSKRQEKIVDRGPIVREGIFDDPALWEGADGKPHEEIRHAYYDDDAGSDGFGFASRDVDEPTATNEPQDAREPRTGYADHSNAYDHSTAHGGEARPISPGFNLIPEENVSIHREREADVVTIGRHAGTEAAQESRNFTEEHQEHHVSGEFGIRSSTKDKSITEIPFETYLIKERVQHKEDDQSITQPHFNGPPISMVDTPPSDKGVSFEEPPEIIQEHISTPSRASLQTPNNETSVSLEDVADRSPARPPNTSKYGRTSFADLPVVHEENPAEIESDHLPPHPHYDGEPNRDSAFVTGSPVPRQRGLPHDHDEHVRDSGVHLRDFSPTEKSRAHVSSTDDALARLSWPHVDEETETVDLHRSQGQNIETSPAHHNQERVVSISSNSDSHDSHPPKGDKATDFSRSQRSMEERPKQHSEAVASRDLFPSYKSTEERSTKHHDKGTSRDQLPSQHAQDEKHTDLHRISTILGHGKPREDSLVKQRVQRIESPDIQRPIRPKEDKYAELSSSQGPKAERLKGVSEMEAGAAVAGVTLGFAAARKLSQEQRPPSAQSQRSSSNINRLRTPDPKRPESVASNRSGTPPLRRSDRKLSGDLRSLSQRSKPDLAKEAELAALASSASQVSTANPTANEGRVRAKDMADVYDGFGEGRMGSPRSPTRPHSMRRRQSMQVLDLESKVEQLAAENRMLTEARAQAERALELSSHAPASLVEKDAEIDSLKRTLDWLQNEVTRLTQVNEGLNSAHVELGRQHNERYGALESQHAQATRELQEARDAHDNLSAGMEGIVGNEVQSAVQYKDREIAQLRAELDAAKNQISEMQRQILASKADQIDFLTIRDEDYLDNACQTLCQHVQQWVLRFSKFSDMRACRLSSEINNEKTLDRLDNAILDGSDVDNYLSDRIKRRDVFMSMTMNMVWEFIFTRYLFGMDREQRQKLKSLEKILSEVGPAAAVHHWRATTLTLLSKREAFLQQREQDTQAVVHAIIETLSEILPPPSHLEAQIEEQLTRVMKEAVDLSIEMRTQRAEYMMLPPLLPEYDANGDLASKVSFNAALMNERSGDTVSNEELEEQKAIVRIVLFPLVVKKGDDRGEGDEEIVVCPAQVLVAKPKKSVRVFSPGSVQGHSRISLQSSMPADYGDGSVI